MRTCLFIKSYKADFPWLKYAIKSIDKFCTGYEEVLIVVPRTDYDEANSFVFADKHVTTMKLIALDDPANGYLYQQVVKMNAHLYTDCEWIQYFDSDCIFTTPTNPNDYREDGKVWMYCTPYSKCGTGIIWQEPTEQALGFKVDMEYMRRQNFVYNRSTLMHIQEKYPNINLHIMNQPGRHFSEFNFMGAFAHKFEPDLYLWKNTDEHPIVPERLRQFHSYSEYTEETIKWIENILAS